MSSNSIPTRNFKYVITVSEHDPRAYDPHACWKKLAFPGVVLAGKNQQYSAACPRGRAGMGGGLVQVHFHSAWRGRLYNAAASAIAGQRIDGPAIVQHTRRQRHHAFKVRPENEDAANQYWASVSLGWKRHLDLMCCGRHWWFVQRHGGPEHALLIHMKLRFG